MSPVGFRTRLFLILTLFATLPSIVLTLVWAGTFARALPLVSGSSAWERAAATGGRAIAAAQQAPLSASDRAALRAHEIELQESLTQARRFGFIAQRAVPIIAVIAIACTRSPDRRLIARRGSLEPTAQSSRFTSWSAGRIGLGAWTELPEGPPRKGAPEFAVLRSRMRSVARELRDARAREIEAERLRAFRESARQVAHELKNPLTPIRFAVARLRREAPPSLADAVEVLDAESRRLEEMARSFSQFGRLPEGPAADVDVAELVRYTTRASVPPDVEADVRIEGDVPMIRGSPRRAGARTVERSSERGRRLSCGREAGASRRPRIGVTVARERNNGDDGIVISVRDSGCGIAPDKLARIWEPYVTHKPGGTGLGLAIARQAILAHNGTVHATSVVGDGTEIRFTLPTSGIDATEAVSADSR